MLFRSSAQIADLTQENERLRLLLALEQANTKVLQNKVIDLQLTLQHETLDREVLEQEYTNLKNFIRTTFQMPDQTLPRLSIGSVLPYTKPKSPPLHRVSLNAKPLLLTMMEEEDGPVKPLSNSATEAKELLDRSAAILQQLKRSTKLEEGQRTVKIQEEWTEEPIPALNSNINSTEWNKLLVEWAQGDARKFDYLSKWLTHHLNGPSSSSSPYGSPRVELKSMTPDVLDRFLKLILPKLRIARPDLDVKCFTKDYVGHSLRIVVENKSPRYSRPSSSLASIQEC
ncbi:hypothetical protein THRCLA_06975 [Thraustotheca clavata]|uniref:Uncharacterized protein n=1 Tax=Thraustotheca clavata TaxID=74557 RepID=A0A1V9ZHE5_9STRA|nr:hypothetical protein THRCLA_06975 [Thraustotheca clavata]